MVVPKVRLQHLERDQSRIDSKFFCQRLHVPLQELPRAHRDLLLEFVATDGRDEARELRENKV
jgi:hypothetical protein